MDKTSRAWTIIGCDVVCMQVVREVLNMTRSCFLVCNLVVALYHKQKFLTAKYFTGEIFRELNFCGRSHLQILTPLKLNGRAETAMNDKAIGQYQRHSVYVDATLTRRYGKLQTVRLFCV